jgi:hypothetical protein
MQERMRSSISTVLMALCLLAALPACTTTRVEPIRTVQAAGMAPVLVVEQFLRAANSNDFDTMARLWGTRDGNMLRRWPREEIDRRMMATASLLRHQDYGIEGEQIVPGRREEAVQLIVRLRINQRDVQVPFTMVLTRSGDWLVEEIGLDRIRQTL